MRPVPIDKCMCDAFGKHGKSVKEKDGMLLVMISAQICMYACHSELFRYVHM